MTGRKAFGHTDQGLAARARQQGQRPLQRGGAGKPHRVPATVEEAAIGPLLERCLIWIDKMRKGEEHFLTNHFYKIRLKTFLQAKSLSDFLMPGPVRILVERSMKTYGLLKWPLQVYRWVKKRSPWVIAVDVGWFAVKRAGFVYVFGKAFDKACVELEIVYRHSKMIRKEK